ncbi:siderophore-interacting protein [Paracoccus sp. MBLB3053]|uniref:Siderophore-interacting protein n=1 Tax=Paracoccus aurantius TaxID=3073814 RepID=A0ABU2HPC5_9RHOB|nr:siderophore-interacting protein [Paracoccus sp. MBLB3053]MDS9466449.1 siderophore-interacting protein [Paracoccus sp. MBLB3053]
MRRTKPPEFHSEVLLRDTDFAMLDRLLRSEAREHGLDLHDGHGRSTWCQTEWGEFGAKKRGGDVLIFARAHRPEWLAAMKETITDHVMAAMPGRALTMRWSSLADIGKPPANFSLARAGQARRISEDFVRLRLHSPDLTRLASEDSIHFRLLLPAPGDGRPEWPRVGANGQTNWPAGAKALHRPVYTIRKINAAEGWLDTDIYLHSGGRVTQWVLHGAGPFEVGLIGPSGGGIPRTAKLVLAADESGYPAIARIIEARPQAQGTVWLMGRRNDYPMPSAPNLEIFHLPEGADALPAILASAPPPADAFLWMAAEKGSIAAIRRILLQDPEHDPHLTHLSAYWSRPSADPASAE